MIRNKKKKCMLNVVDDDVTTKLCVNGEPSSFFLKYYGVLTLPFPVQPVCLGVTVPLPAT